MGWFSKGNVESGINWKHLRDEEQLNDLIALSNTKDVVLFKHSTRCSVSSMALSRLEREWDLEDGPEMVYLDLIQFRNISNKIASELGVKHESPQVILLRNESVVYHDSHNMISLPALKAYL